MCGGARISQSHAQLLSDIKATSVEGYIIFYILTMKRKVYCCDATLEHRVGERTQGRVITGQPSVQLDQSINDIYYASTSRLDVRSLNESYIRLK